MIDIDMPGQLIENDCSRTILVAQSLNPHFPFPNRINLSRTVKWWHLWSTGSLFCAHTTLCPEIFKCLLIFAHRYSHNLWYLPTDLCLSADICKIIFAGLLIFARWSSHICWYLPLQIFACRLIFAHSKTLHVCWYLPKDLCASSDICPQQIFAHLLIFAHRSWHICWYLRTPDICIYSDICPQINNSCRYAQNNADQV